MFRPTANVRKTRLEEDALQLGGTRFLRILACLCSFRSAEQIQLQHYDLAALI